MKTDLFEFDLPEKCIALRPCVPRDAARLLVVDPRQKALDDGSHLKDQFIKNLPQLLQPGDLLVINDTRVIPAALNGVRLRDDLRAAMSCNLIKRLENSSWQVLARPAKKMHLGDIIRFGNVNLTGSTEQLTATVSDKGDAGVLNLTFNISGDELDKAIAHLGQMPIPPYIAGKREADESDQQDYQTIFAANDGAVAAPTAGLHFSPQLLKALEQRGIERHTLTLHVGAGTFLPVKSDNIDDHKMHAEWGEITKHTADILNDARKQRRRIIAVGTTSLRLLESAAQDDGTIEPFEGETSIFMSPGYRFKAVDGLITNFHLPRSTLFMLVAAFSGLENMQQAYAHAIKNEYRFYSYGDANLLFRSQ